MNFAIVTSANSRYFRLCLDLIRSVLDHQPYDLPLIDLVVVDQGLEPYERAFLERTYAETPVSVCSVQETGLDQLLFTGDKIHLQSQWGYLGRPFINKIPFEDDGPTYILWMDSDMWVQNTWAINYFLKAAALGKIAAVPEIERTVAYNAHHRSISWPWAYGNYQKFYGSEVAELFCKLGTALPMINNGIFCIKRDDPFWTDWQSNIMLALDTNQYQPDFGIDQISFNKTVYEGKMESFEPLPLICNWMVSHSTPHVLNDRLVCPAVPFEEIGILHLLDNTKWNRMGLKHIDASGKLLHSGTTSSYLNYSEFRHSHVHEFKPLHSKDPDITAYPSGKPFYQDS